jgi:hypothetical protein
MPAKKKAARKAKPKKAKKVARKVVVKKARKVVARKPAKPAGPQYGCILCGVEVAITRSGLGISRLMCCGQPMERR